ncbi:acetolactate decarboxylase [Loigolactobacillus backii]|uniref:Alpha-acetolactate decarboxylase n=1 Tax=Loigolactobacillus backii TaxID=375175 RepID=A0A192H283_9LACO|nr:acetolactate decarboxylase [Loigolactobacillus backii]ANK62388.1 alpha-acetolactate decarboxylase [Loigolactobacillus backii]ANK70600.1 alpha-acetolactate decarboxylase [Loigolactobacillus backii]PIO82859.1 acetolactate decarboxylase [Loigolactobacillus backii]
MAVTDKSVLYQHGTLSLLVPGLFEGTMTIGELLQHGNSGIGTVQDFNGEMVILDGHAYQVVETGEVHELTAEQSVPFATVHFDDPKVTTHETKLTKADVEQKLLTDYPYKNVFYAVKIRGIFSHMLTRVVQKQEKPYPNLTESTKTQPKFKQENVEGTLIGYYAPELFQGVAVAGYHVHFLSNDHSIGGHVLDYTLAEGDVSIQPFASLQQHFPLEDPAFLKEDFNYAGMSTSINKAEK